MLIELRSRCPVRLWWHDSLECSVTRSRIISLKTTCKLLGWVIVNGIVDSDRVLVELVNPIGTNIPAWGAQMETFATEEQAKHNVLTRVRARLNANADYRRWAGGGGVGTGWMPRLTSRLPEFITVSETW